MKGSKIFLAWLFTVLITSLLLPSVIIAFPSLFKTKSYGVSNIIENYFKTALIIIPSVSVLTLPSIITLLIRNKILREKYSFKESLRKINKTHLLVSLITIMIPLIYFILIELMAYQLINNMQKSSYSFSLNRSPLLPLLSIFICYFFCAIPIWYTIFKKEIQNSKTSFIK